MDIVVPYLTLGQRLVSPELPHHPTTTTTSSLPPDCQADALFWVLLGCGKEHGGVRITHIRGFLTPQTPFPYCMELAVGKGGLRSQEAPNVCDRLDFKILLFWPSKCKHRSIFSTTQTLLDRMVKTHRPLR